MASDSTDSEDSLKPFVYYDRLSFQSFLIKIVTGTILSFIPALVYVLITETNLYTVWGITLLMSSGIYFLIGGCSDLSQTSARKRFKKYMADAERTGQRERGFQYDIGMTQLGKNWENIAAAVCMFAISVLISGLAN